MADKGKGKKSLISKLKSSPAAKQYREEGPKKVAKTIGGIVKEGVQDFADKAMDAVFPLDNTHQQTRMGHFTQGSQEHMTVLHSDLPRAGSIADKFHEKGITPGTFKKDNVSSIMNAFEIRERKAPPEGY